MNTSNKVDQEKEAELSGHLQEKIRSEAHIIHPAHPDAFWQKMSVFDAALPG